MHRARIIGDKKAAVIEEGSQLQEGQFTGKDEDVRFVRDEGEALVDDRNILFGAEEGYVEAAIDKFDGDAGEIFW